MRADKQSEMISLSELEFIDEVCGRFEDDWKAATRDGPVPAVSDVLPDGAPAEVLTRHRPLICELLRIDLEYRWKMASELTGQEPDQVDGLPVPSRVEDYCQLLSGLADDGEIIAELAVAEYRARLLSAEKPSLAEFVSRFGESHPVVDQLRQLANSAATSYLPRQPVQNPAVGQDDGTIENSAARRLKQSPTTVRIDPDRQIERVDEYVLLEKIGQGGMGAVYRAWQPELSRTVALKTALSGVGVSEELLARFQTEAEAMAGLDHPGIVRIYDVGDSAGMRYFTMEFIDGLSLAEKLRDGPLTPKVAAKLVVDISDAIEFAHQRGVIHRDLKPGNVMLDADERPRVTDFGLARQADSGADLTATGQILGTPGYMPPEQASGLTSIGTPADIYSLGAVLYACLTGRPPFQAADILETLRQVTDDEPVSPRLLNPRLDRDLETICLKCLEKKTEHRYPSAAGLRDDLTRWLNGESITARRPGRVERLVKWTRRRPALASLAAVSALSVLLLGGATIAWWDNERLQTALDDTARARRLEEQARIAESEARSEAETARKLEEEARIAAEQSAAREATARQDAEKSRDQEAAARTAEAAARRRAENAEQRLRRSEYLGRIALSRLDWQYGRTRRVDYLLKNTPTEWRGWEWDFLMNLNHQEIRSISPNPSAMALGRDGTLLFAGAVVKNDAQAGAFRTLIDVRDAEYGHFIRSIGRRTNAYVHNILAGPNGDWLIVNTVEDPQRDRKFHLERWNASTGKVERTFSDGDANLVHSGRGKLALSPDGKWLAGANWLSNRIIVWSVEGDREQILFQPELSSREAMSVDFSPESEFLAGVFRDGLIAIWKVESGELIHQIPPAEDSPAGTMCLKYSPDGGRLVTASGLDIFCHDTADWSTVWRFKTNASVNRIAFSENGQQVAFASESTLINLHDAETGELISSLHGHNEFVSRVAFTPSGKLLSVGRGDGIKLWNPSQTSGEAVVLKCDNAVKSLAFNPDGTQLVAAGGPESGSQGDFVSVFDVVTRERSFHGTDHTGSVQSVAFAPDGNSLVTASWDWRVGIWNLTSDDAPEFHNDGAGSGLERIAIHPDGEWIAASGSGRRYVAIWNRQSGELQANLRVPADGHPVKRFGSLAFSPDGSMLVATTEPSGPHFWTTGTWEYQGSLQEYKGGRIRYRGVAFSPAGDLLATPDPGGATLIWDVNNRELLRRLDRHYSLVTSAAFDATGTRLATSSFDGTVKIWDVQTGDELLTLTGHRGEVNCVAFSPDGYLLASGGNDGTVRIYDGTPREDR